MSQFYQGVVAGSLPPSVPTTFTADDTTTATPVANNLNVFSNDITTNNNNGVQTTASGSTLTIQLTNRIQGQTSTVGNVTSDVITFSLGATPGAFKFHFEVVAFESTTPAGLGYSIEASARTDGISASIISLPDADEDEDPALTVDADWQVIASGNNVIVRVTGVTALTLNWGCVGTYVYRG